MEEIERMNTLIPSPSPVGEGRSPSPCGRGIKGEGI